MFEGFSFSMSAQSKKPQQKHNIQVDQKQEKKRVLISELQLEQDQNVQDKPKVIQAQPNTFGKPQVNYTMTNIAPDKQDIKFENGGENLGSKQIKVYGLQQQVKRERDNEFFKQTEDTELKKLKQALKTMADVDEDEAYQEMPIEDFGLAMMRGMGWQEGKPIGRRCKEIVKPREVIQRPDRMGLGATFKALPKPETHNKSQNSNHKTNLGKSQGTISKQEEQRPT